MGGEKDGGRKYGRSETERRKDKYGEINDERWTQKEITEARDGERKGE